MNPAEPKDPSGPGPADTHPGRSLVGQVAAIDLPPGEPGGHEDRAVVVLLHGIGGNAAGFAGLQAELARAGYRSVAWDAPGYGATPDPASDPGLDGYVRAVLALVEAVGCGPVHLVGVSWGGVIATAVAARAPGQLVSLALLDSTRGSGTGAEKAAAMRARIDDLAALGPAAFALRRAPRLLAPRVAPEVAAEVERQMAQIRSAGYRGAAHMMADTDNGSILGSLRVPTLVVVGEHDRVTGVPESELLAGRIPGARLCVVPDAGHAAAQEQPALVARHLLELYRSLEGTGREPT